VECVLAKRLTQRHGAAKRRDEGHFGLDGLWQRHHAGWCADIAKQREHVFGDQLACVFGTPVWLVAVIQTLDFNHAFADAALRVDVVKADLRALEILDTQLGCRPGQCSRLPEDDFGLGLRASNGEPSR